MADGVDQLIFRVSPTGLSLVGGTGRGAGWMGIVDLPLESEPLAARVLRSSRTARLETAEATRVVGPYWAPHALVVPVGTEHLVVFGGQHPLPDSDATLVPEAARLVAELQQVPPEKLLADELEVVQAVRDLMDCQPESVEETARHIAERSADPLSCEVGAVLVRANGRLIAEVVTRDWPAVLDSGRDPGDARPAVRARRDGRRPGAGARGRNRRCARPERGAGREIRRAHRPAAAVRGARHRARREPAARVHEPVPADRARTGGRRRATPPAGDQP